MTHKRGEMHSPILATQERDYSGLRWGTITPTDIDGIIDFKDKAWVVFELKHSGADMSFGQKLALERLVDDLDKTKPTIGFIAEHNTTGIIDASNANVTKYRWNKKWYEDTRKINLKIAIDGFLIKIGIIFEAEKPCPVP